MYTDPYLASVAIFAGNFAPMNWMFCNGQLLSIAQYTALFSLIGTYYGGDGQTTFALPDFRSRTAICAGQGLGLSNYNIGQAGGSESFTMTSGSMPLHTHGFVNLVGGPTCNAAAGTLPSPSGNVPAGGLNIYNTTGADQAMALSVSNASSPASGGGPQPISLITPYLAMNYIIAVEGIYPSRS
jgi:microcystin-dependent protein